jgi:hypothetical protein
MLAHAVLLNNCTTTVSARRWCNCSCACFACTCCRAPQNALTQRIVDARKKLKSVQIAYESRVKISAICSELNVDGIRGDIVTNRAAKALASFEGRDEVAVEDIYRCAVMRLTNAIASCWTLHLTCICVWHVSAGAAVSRNAWTFIVFAPGLVTSQACAQPCRCISAWTDYGQRRSSLLCQHPSVD